MYTQLEEVRVFWRVQELEFRPSGWVAMFWGASVFRVLNSSTLWPTLVTCSDRLCLLNFSLVGGKLLGDGWYRTQPAPCSLICRASAAAAVWYRLCLPPLHGWMSRGAT